MSYHDKIQFSLAYTSLDSFLRCCLFFFIFSSSLADGSHCAGLVRAATVFSMPRFGPRLATLLQKQRHDCFPPHFQLYVPLVSVAAHVVVTVGRFAVAEWTSGASSTAWFILPLTPTSVVPVPLTPWQITSLFITEVFIAVTLVAWLLVSEAPATVVRYKGLALIGSYQDCVVHEDEAALERMLEEARQYIHADAEDDSDEWYDDDGVYHYFDQDDDSGTYYDAYNSSSESEYDTVMFFHDHAAFTREQGLHSHSDAEYSSDS